MAAKEALQPSFIEELGTLLLNIGTTLMCSGATTARTREIIDRISGAYNMKADLFITHRALTITVTNPVTKENYSRLKRSPPQRVNYKVVSGISHLSWDVKENNVTIEQAHESLAQIESLSHYPRFIVLMVVGLADACFCYFIGGTYPAIGAAFIATVAGLFTRQQAHKKGVNPYLCVMIASFVATLIAGVFEKLFPGLGMENAFAACVLFLIPGVPMINAVTDLVEGNILNGILRSVNAFIIALMIAIGMIISISIFKY